MTADLARAAFRLALRGCPVFPLAPGGKIPLIPREQGGHGCHDGTTNPDVVRTWWTKHPRANIAAATGARSSFWVLDVDAQHGGIESLAALEAEHGPLLVTVESATPSGGRHLYFRWQANKPEIRNSTSRLAPGIDVRGEGGSVVMPPSVLADGRGYQWVRNGACGFADAPEWLIARALPPPPPPRPAPRPLTGDVSKYVEIGRAHV